jgi:hypothetical protein
MAGGSGLARPTGMSAPERKMARKRQVRAFAMLLAPLSNRRLDARYSAIPGKPSMLVAFFLDRYSASSSSVFRPAHFSSSWRSAS